MPIKILTNSRITVRVDSYLDWDKETMYIVVTYHIPEINKYEKVRFEANEISKAKELLSDLTTMYND